MQPTQNTATNPVTDVTTDLVVALPATLPANVSTSPARVLRAAAGYLHYYGWWQDDMFDNPESPTPCACPLGAIRMSVIGTPEVRAEHLRVDVLATFNLAVAVFADYLIRTYGAAPVRMPWDDGDYDPTEVLFPGDLEQVVIRWNDHPVRNVGQVIAALNGAADEWDRAHGIASTGPVEYPALPQVCPHNMPIGACECDASTDLGELKAEIVAEFLAGVR